MSEIISRYILSIQITPWKESDEFLPQVIAFKEGDKYYLAGFEQIAEEIKELLPEIEENQHPRISFALEIREGDKIEAEIVSEILASGS